MPDYVAADILFLLAAVIPAVVIPCGVHLLLGMVVVLCCIAAMDCYVVSMFLGACRRRLVVQMMMGSTKVLDCWMKLVV